MSTELENHLPCQPCKGEGRATMLCRNARTCSYEEHIVVCPGCLGKGYVDDSDRKRVCSVEQFYQII